MDKELTWKQQIKLVETKTSKILGILVRVRRYISLTTLKTIYNALIYPHMTYCNTLVIFFGQEHMKQSSKVLKNSIENLWFELWHYQTIDRNQDHYISKHIRIKFLPHSDICAFLFAWKFTLSLQRLFFNAEMTQLTCIIPVSKQITQTVKKRTVWKIFD